MPDVTVICARPDGQNEAVGPPVAPVLDVVSRFTDSVHFAGRFPNKDIDPLLSGRIVVIGEEAHLAAVVLRMVRRGLLGSPESGPPSEITPVGYIALQRNEFTARWRLGHGVDAVETAFREEARPVPLARDDAGGVLVGSGRIDDPAGTGYLDEHQILAGTATRIVVRPDPVKGLAVTVERRRALKLPPKRETALGRAFSIGFDEPTTVVGDGVTRPRPMPRWTWFAHTEPLWLARPADR